MGRGRFFFIVGMLAAYGALITIVVWALMR